MAQFPPNCSISGSKNQGKCIIMAAVFQVMAPMVESKHDTVGRNTELAGVLGCWSDLGWAMLLAGGEVTLQTRGSGRQQAPR